MAQSVIPCIPLPMITILFLVIFNVMEHLQDKFVPAITYAIAAAINSPAFPFFSLLQLIRLKKKKKTQLRTQDVQIRLP